MRNEHKHEHDCQNQLDWSAFCYLSGEMSLTDTEQFEARLADDQAAREALARMVELTQVVAAAETHAADLRPAGEKRTSWTARISWMAIGGLAAAVLAMLWSGAGFWNEPSGENTGISRATNALASAWFETRRELRDADDIGPLHPIPLALSETDDESAAATGNTADDLLVADAPSWMTAALQGLAGEMDQDETGGDEAVVN
ncbi:MAG TPA: hypothetical protein VFV87_13675 [Pirellulaceae bacterium]|nr:hypothetical protein [Pirellulaceae bacterium]